MEVELWCQVTNLDARKPAPGPVLEMESTARDVCMAIGDRKLLERDGVGTLLSFPQNYFAPGAADAAYQDVAPLMHFRKIPLPMAEKFARFDLLSRLPVCLRSRIAPAECERVPFELVGHRHRPRQIGDDEYGAASTSALWRSGGVRERQIFCR